jgi:hypothetical protein
MKFLNECKFKSKIISISSCFSFHFFFSSSKAFSSSRFFLTKIKAKITSKDKTKIIRGIIMEMDFFSSFSFLSCSVVVVAGSEVVVVMGVVVVVVEEEDVVVAMLVEVDVVETIVIPPPTDMPVVGDRTWRIQLIGEE